MKKKKREGKKKKGEGTAAVSLIFRRKGKRTAGRESIRKEKKGGKRRTR